MMTDNFLLLGVIFFIFYFLLIRPQQKRVKQHQEMMKGLKKGDKVLTNGGIIGTIAKLEDNDIAVVEIAQGVRVRINRSAVSEVLDEKAGEGANDN
ncbi:MAG: preprotein translocase subunit YajC [Pseudomonadota bacterium]|nr:preprotein translocase subunit YajC [Pseudomonadota bacterium]